MHLAPGGARELTAPTTRRYTAPVDRSRYRSLFVAEARRTIADAQAALARDPVDGRALLRAFHTLNGMSATMGLGALVALAHALEDVCEASLAGSVPLDGGVRDLLRHALGRLEEQVAEVEAGQEPGEDAALVDAVRGHLAAAAHTGFRLLTPETPEEEEDVGDEPTADVAVDTLALVLGACARLRARTIGDPEAQAEITRVTDGVRLLHAELSALRGVPFATVVAPLRRRLRALCASIGRDAVLEIEGEQVRVEQDVLGQLQAALVHLLDNAVLHGVEPAAERGAKGPVGRIVLRAAREGDQVVVDLADDGRGLDAAGLQEVAGEPGADPVALALRPGLSTGQPAGAPAGRGEGLPAAAELVARLGGVLHVQSTPGLGTRVRVRVPLFGPLPSTPPATVAGDAGILPDAPPRGSS